MKISFKVGLWFFVCILIIETTSMLFLHSNVVDSRIEQELLSLKARGNSHRDVLELSADASTLHHIGLMESHTDTDVVITNKKGEVLLTSQKITPRMKAILEIRIDHVPRQGRIVQSNWKDEQYISTVTAFNGDNSGDTGYVYMFKDTSSVGHFIMQLNKHFLLASILILLFMLITVFFLSKALTKPLLLMKDATTKLSIGDFSVQVPVHSHDELGELAQSIQKLANDLNFLKQERNEFLASISHELRTPLTYIKGYADVVRRQDLDEDDKAQYLTIIHEESERLSKLLEELFDLARLDQNTFTITKEKVNLGQFLQTMYDKVFPAFRNKHINLTIECKDSLFLYLDPVRFEQILLNLLNNALKFSKEGSTTHIKAFKKEQGIFISLCDQGIGIPEEDLPYIFDRLYRVEKSRSRISGGFGLGLAIVKELVEVHQGTISVDSKLGKGTCFTLMFKEQKNENSSISG